MDLKPITLVVAEITQKCLKAVASLDRGRNQYDIRAVEDLCAQCISAGVTLLEIQVYLQSETHSQPVYQSHALLDSIFTGSWALFSSLEADLDGTHPAPPGSFPSPLGSISSLWVVYADRYPSLVQAQHKILAELASLFHTIHIGNISQAPYHDSMLEEQAVIIQSLRELHPDLHIPGSILTRHNDCPFTFKLGSKTEEALRSNVTSEQLSTSPDALLTWQDCEDLPPEYSPLPSSTLPTTDSGHCDCCTLNPQNLRNGGPSAPGDDFHRACLPIMIRSGELKYKMPFDQEIPQVLHLFNPNPTTIAWRVRTTSPKLYCVRPNSGILQGKAGFDVSFILMPISIKKLSKQRQDKFLIQSKPLENTGRPIWESGPNNSTPTDGTQMVKLRVELQDEKGNIIRY